MIDRRREQLMQDMLDGQASPEQIRELQAWLASTPEGRARFEELEGLFKTLGDVPHVATPVGLKDQVVQAIRHSHGAPVLVPRPRPARWAPLRPAFLFIAGVAAGVIGYSGLTQLPSWPPGDDRAAGTLMPQPGAGPGAEGNRRSWTAGLARIEALAWQRRGAPVVTLKAHANAEVVVEYPAALKLRAIAQSGVPGSPFWSEPGRVTIAAVGGSSYEIAWEAGAAPPPAITVTVRSGIETTRGELPLGPAR